MSTNITAISDTHGMHEQLHLPGGDILIHAGDVGESKYGTLNFIRWFDEQDYDLKVFIAGNHDYYIEAPDKEFTEVVNSAKSVIYLQDDFLHFNDIKIWGSPWSRNLPGWAFQLSDSKAEEFWKTLPNDIDILITHGPANCYGDLLMYPRPGESANCGCRFLYNRVEEIKPKYHISGHIHEAYGQRTNGSTRFINASSVDIRYRVVNPPITFTI